MVLKSHQKVADNRYELEISIEPDIFQSEIDKVYKRKKSKISIPGFRKGKAPKSFIEKYYGEGIFYEDAINNLYFDAVQEGLKQLNLEFVNDKIDFDIVKVGKEDGLIFKVKVTTMPDVKIDNYKGIEYKKESAEVTDEDIENRMKKVQKDNGRLVTVSDRPAKMTDTVVIDFKGTADGGLFDGGTAEDYTLELGSGKFVPGFEEQIVGHSAGEKFNIQVKFPNDYHVPNMQGKDVNFEINLKSIKELELPDIDDEFVKDISEFDTLEEYKADLVKHIAKDKEKAVEQKIDNQIFDKLVELVEVIVPDALIKEEAQKYIDELKHNIQNQGIPFEEFMKYTGDSIENFQKQYWKPAEKSVKLRLALNKIVELENIEASDEEIDNEYEKIAKNYKMEVNKLKKIFDRSIIKNDILNAKALKLIKDNAVVIND